MASAIPSWLRRCLPLLALIPAIVFGLPQEVRPATMALALALTTRRPALAMNLGAIYGLWLLLPEQGIWAGMQKYWLLNFADSWHLCVMGFALILLGLVQVMTRSGGTSALLVLAVRKVRTRRGAKISTALAGLCVFFDDYANALVVGPTLQPLTDKFGVSRQKLAYLVDCTAAPVAGLAVLSTWVGYEVGLFQGVADELQIARGGYAMLLAVLPYRFYCVFALILVFVSSYWERDFSPMHAAEVKARLERPSIPVAPVSQAGDTGAWANAVIPIGLLLLCVPVGLLLDGGIAPAIAHDPSRLLSLVLYRDSVMASENNVQVLFLAGVVAAIVAFVIPWWKGQCRPRPLAVAFAQGVKLGAAPLLILVSAWALAGVCKDLKTGAFLVEQLGASLSPGWLPLGSFLLSALVAFCTGTSWGTMAIVIPAIAPLAHSAGGEFLLLVTLASVLDGAIFGDHCSPLSDTTVMSCVATGCDLMAHVVTQLPYAMCAMLSASVCGYLYVAHGGNVWLSYLMGIALQIGTLAIFARPLSASRRSLS